MRHELEKCESGVYLTFSNIWIKGKDLASSDFWNSSNSWKNKKNIDMKI